MENRGWLKYTDLRSTVTVVDRSPIHHNFISGIKGQDCGFLNVYGQEGVGC